MVLRVAVITALLGLWLAIGIAWGLGAALIFGFFVFFACVFAVWAVVAGRLDQRAGRWYYDRQLNRRGNGRWRR
jgi:hypothetical protein